MSSTTVANLLKRDNNNFDLVRVLCASFVIFGHSYRVNPIPGQEGFVRAFTGFTYSSALAVKIFFFISGMLVTNSLLRRRSVSVFALSRFFRVFPALWLVVVVTAFVIGPIVSRLSLSEYFANGQVYKYVYGNMLMSTQHFLPGVFEKHPWGHYVNSSLWTLRVEIKCYLGLLCLYIFTGPRKMFLNVVAGIIVADAIFHLGYIGISATTELSLLPFSFALGILMAVNKDVVKINWYIAGACILGTIALWQVPHVNEIMLITTICALIILFSGASWVRKIKVTHDISYGVYLWGFLVQQLIYHIFGTQNIYLYIVECLLVSYICGYISFVTVEQHAINIGYRFTSRISSSFDGLAGIILAGNRRSGTS